MLLVVMLLSIRENEGDNRIGFLDPHPACSLALDIGVLIMHGVV